MISASGGMFLNWIQINQLQMSSWREFVNQEQMRLSLVGTDGVTLEKILDLMARVRRYTVPCILEISSIETVTPGFDLYFIPTVLNSRDTKWITGLHQAGR